MSRTPSRRTGTPGKKTPLKSPTAKTPSARLNDLPPADDAGSPTPTAKRGKRLADSLEAVSRATPKRRASPGKPLPSFDDDVFGGSPGAGASVSQETFRANERLRRQREARNFVFEGDAHAPRQTRSGRVVAEPLEASYGEDAPEERTDEDEFGAAPDPEPEPMAVDEAPAPGAAVKPLLPLAQKRIVDVLATLNGRFTEAEDSEALKGLVALLSGTVQRGEGNSALVTGPRGVGKTRTVEAALRKLPSTPATAPIVVRLSGLAQSDDRRAIREMGRQIALAEGKADEEAADDDLPEDYAPTTLPSHLLALLTAASERAIIIVLDEFDLFTEHARQALLYCLLDVVQSVQTGPGTGRGVAVIGVTSRVDTLLLLEKRVKSRFSHRVWRVESPLAPGQLGWKGLLQRTLVPWAAEADAPRPAKRRTQAEKDLESWQDDWEFAVGMLLENEEIGAALDRLVGLSVDVRTLFRPFVAPVCAVLGGRSDFLTVPVVLASVRGQVEQSGWSLGGTQRRVPPPTPSTAASSVPGTPSSQPATPGASTSAHYGVPATPSKTHAAGSAKSQALAKLRSLPHPALCVLIIAKHMQYTGRGEFTFAQLAAEYQRFARLKLVGVGKVRWSAGILRLAWNQCVALGLVQPAAPQGQSARFNRMRCALAGFEIVQFFRNGGGDGMGPELVGWGRLAGGHA